MRIMCARCEVWGQGRKRDLLAKGWQLKATYQSYEHTDEVWVCPACEGEGERWRQRKGGGECSSTTDAKMG